MSIILIFACCLILNSFAMEQTKIIPLKKTLEAKFSPNGKYVVACQKKNIKVYDAYSGAIKGSLPNFPLKACKSAQGPLEYQFSPQGTYFYATFTDRVWKLSDITEHLPGLLAARLIKLWNAQETVFLSAPRFANPPQANIWHVHNAIDGTIINSIDHRIEGIPSSPRISANGKLLSFIYETQNGSGKKAVITYLNYGMALGYKQEITDANQVEFCPDNEHVLISLSTNIVVVRNFKTRQEVYKFICASKTSGYSFDSYSVISNACRIKPKGLNNIIKNKLTQERYVISQQDDKFTISRLVNPEDVIQISTRVSEKLSIVQKNIKVPFPGGLACYDVYLVKKKNNQTCLVDEVYKAGKNVRLAGHHNEQVVIIEPVKNLLYIFDPYNAQELHKINFRRLVISPHAQSCIVKAKEKDERTEKWKLYILPSAAQLLGNQQNSYFSILPEDLRLKLRNYTT